MGGTLPLVCLRDRSVAQHALELDVDGAHPTGQRVARVRATQNSGVGGINQEAEGGLKRLVAEAGLGLGGRIHAVDTPPGAEAEARLGSGKLVDEPGKGVRMF